MTEPQWTDADQNRAKTEGWSLQGGRIQMIPHGPFNSVDKLILHLKARAKHGDGFAWRAVNIHSGTRETPKTIQRYVATVHLVIPSIPGGEGGACDMISDVLNGLVEDDIFDDWGYARYGGHWLHPTRIPVNNPDHPDFPGTMLRYENDAL